MHPGLDFSGAIPARGGHLWHGQIQASESELTSCCQTGSGSPRDQDFTHRAISAQVVSPQEGLRWTHACSTLSDHIGRHVVGVAYQVHESCCKQQAQYCGLRLGPLSESPRLHFGCSRDIVSHNFHPLLRHEFDAGFI